MKKDNLLKKLFNLSHFGIKIITVVLSVLYLIVYLKTKKGIFLSYVGPAVFFTVFVSYNCLLTCFHKKGLYTSRQAAEFYRKCREDDVSFINDKNFKKAEAIYFSIFGTNKYFGAGTFPAHMEKIYNAGRETTEKSG